ncbi:MAG: hypothetical protein K6E84_06890 [Lachnospiraceae bacterium]|nr:hypothetical protein [Lachnospiraceae bacterium]
MSINISPRTDYSTLFSSMSASSGKANSMSWLYGDSQSSGINLSDYASIKNGSYGKLLKTYYSQNKDDSKASSVSQIVKKVSGNSYDSATKNSALTKATSSLSKSADALLQKGSDSLFEEKDITSKDESGKETTVKGYDRDAIYNAVSAFAKDYNALLDASADSNNNSVLTTAANMTSQTAIFSKSLEKIGIKVGDDNKLSVDKDAFDKADVSAIKNVFNGNGSLADVTKAKSEIIASSAQNDASKASGTYASNGYYANASYLNGSAFTSFV